MIEFKKQMDNEVTRLDGRVEETNEEIKRGFADFKETNTKPIMDAVQEKLK